MSHHVTMLRDAPEFDRAFLDHMIPHHRQAIDAAKLADSRAEHAELNQMASKMVKEQQSEARELEGWRTQWFANR